MTRSLLIPLLLIPTLSFAQLKTPPLDASSMDMTYYPSGYPILKAQGKITSPPLVRIIYSRPQRKDRSIFGEKVAFGKLWRLGANEATEIEFFSSAKIGDSPIEKGRYTMYAIPEKDEWTIILTTETDVWGEMGQGKGPLYDSTKDILHYTTSVEALDTFVEALSMGFQKTENGANLLIAWEKMKVLIPISFN